jgi:hypothetical protein
VGGRLRPHPPPRARGAVSGTRLPRPRPPDDRPRRLRSPNWRRRPTPPVLPRFDVVSRTEREARNDAIDARQRRYLRVMVPCVALMLFGFFVPAPVPLRLLALVVASCLPPIAAIVGNG